MDIDMTLGNTSVSVELVQLLENNPYRRKIYRRLHNMNSMLKGLRSNMRQWVGRAIKAELMADLQHTMAGKIDNFLYNKLRCYIQTRVMQWIHDGHNTSNKLNKYYKGISE